jgi:hypothetical protein
METKHTPEPWITKVYEENQTRILGPIEEDGNRHWIGDIIGPLSNKANAKRIVECVNAFEGIENPAEFISNLKKCLDIYATPELLEKIVREEAESLSK